MRPINHALTCVASCALLSPHLQSFGVAELSLAVAGSLIPCVEKKRTLLHSAVLWAVLLCVSIPLPALMGVHLYALPMGALFHVLFDAFSNRKVPLLLSGRGVCFSMYEDGDPITEDTFAWIMFVVSAVIWIVKHH